MSSQQIAYPEAPVVLPDGPALSPEEPTSVGTTDTSASSGADYFDGHASTQVGEVPDAAEVVVDRAAPGAGPLPGPGATPGKASAGKYDEMGKMVMGLVGTVAAASMHGGGHGGGYGGGYGGGHGGGYGGGYGGGHKKKQSGKSMLIATGAKMAMDMYNKKNGKPTGQHQQPNMYGQPHQSDAPFAAGSSPYGGHGMSHPPPQQQQGYGQYQSGYAAPPQGYYGAQQPGMPPHGHQGPPHGYQ